MAKVIKKKRVNEVSFVVKKVPNMTTQNYSYGYRKFINLVIIFAMVFSLVGNSFTAIAAAGPSGNLDQCANGTSASPGTCTGSSWQNGNLNSSQAHYIEGQSVPYRITLTNIPTSGTHTFVFEYDIIRGSKHSLDYITSYNRTEAAADPCSGITPCVAGSSGDIPAPSSSGSTVSGMPTNSFNSLSAVQKKISIFNGNISDVSYVSQGSLTISNSSTQLAVTFTATQPTVVIAWGGHIASRLDWGVGNSAGNINGSSYHTRLVSFDGSGLGNQDRSLSAGAVVFGNLTVIKHVVNTGGGTALASDFSINVTGSSPNPTTFPGAENGTSVVLQTGSYNVYENEVSNYIPNYSTDCTGTITANDYKICTITNIFQSSPPTTASLTLVKTITNDNGGTAVATDWTLSASGNTNISGVTGSGSVTNAVVDPGTYNLSENGGPSGYSASSWSCVKNNESPVLGSSLDLIAGDSATCTINNNDIQPKITVNKIVNNSNETGTSVASDFTLKVGLNVVTNGVQAGINAGNYTVNESGPAGYTATFTGDCNSDGSITLAVGEEKTCTITNNDEPLPPPTQGTLKVVKVVNNDNGGTAEVSDFVLKVGDTVVTSGSNNNFDPGSYVVSESGSTSGYTATFGDDCDANGNITIEAGKQYVCTITNDDQPGTLIVKKVVSGSDASPELFSFSVNGGEPISFEADGQNDILENAGNFTVLEQPVENYIVSYDNCSEVSVGIGETQTCTITNTYRAPEKQNVDTMFHFMKRICPSYSVINGNEDGGNSDATGGHFTEFANYSESEPHFPAINSAVSPSEIPEECLPEAGWNFNLDNNSSMGTSAQVGPTGANGNYDVALSGLPTVAKDAITSGGQMWITEALQETANFGAIRCYTDALNGDNLEYVTLGTDQTNYPTDVYCIAYNVTPSNICPAPVNYSLVSGINTKTAGFTSTNPVADPLNVANYSNGNLDSNSVLANTVIPPWLDPSLFTELTGASWISTTAVHPGDVGGQGISEEDQWRLYETTFTVPVGASVTPVTLYYTADNSVTVYHNGVEVGNIPEVGTYDVVPDPLPYVFSNTYSTTFNPVVGLNKIDFVVRNSLYPIPVNPTALIYKATYTQQESCGNQPLRYTLTVTKSGDGNGTVDGNSGEGSEAFCDLTQCDPSKEQNAFQETYLAGTVVTLTANPDQDSNFDGSWSGACTGNNPICEITMTGDMSVNAHFALNAINTQCVSNCGGGGSNGGGGGGGGGLPVIPPSGSVLGTSTSSSLSFPAVPEVLGESTTLPRTGMPIGFMVVVMLSAIAILDKKLKLI